MCVCLCCAALYTVVGDTDTHIDAVYICVVVLYIQWLEILTLISASLTENGLSHAFRKNAKTFQVKQ